MANYIQEQVEKTLLNIFWTFLCIIFTNNETLLKLLLDLMTSSDYNILFQMLRLAGGKGKSWASQPVYRDTSGSKLSSHETSLIKINCKACETNSSGFKNLRKKPQLICCQDSIFHRVVGPLVCKAFHLKSIHLL